MTTDDPIEARLLDVPVKFRSLAGRALRGACRSPREAIRAKCLDCSNYATGEAERCSVRLCPLWHVNPYRARAARVRAEPGGAVAAPGATT